MRITYVYWIHNPEETDIETQGYVGITYRLKYRWDRHVNSTCNDNVKNNIRSDTVMDVIFAGSEQQCYDLEWSLRPFYRIGWNIIPGGPRAYMANHTHSEETKEKMRSSALKLKNYRYEITSPLGEVTVTDNLFQYAKERNLDPCNLRSAIKGMKSKFCKGYSGKML